MLLDGAYRTFKGLIHYHYLYLYNRCYCVCNYTYPKSIIYKGYFFVHILDDEYVSVRREVIESEIDYSESVFDKTLKEIKQEATTPQPNL